MDVVTVLSFFGAAALITIIDRKVNLKRVPLWISLPILFLAWALL